MVVCTMICVPSGIWSKYSGKSLKVDKLRYVCVLSYIFVFVLLVRFYWYTSYKLCKSKILVVFISQRLSVLDTKSAREVKHEVEWSLPILINGAVFKWLHVESNYVIAIATLRDWLKRVAPVFKQWEAKPKPIAPCMRDFSRAWSEWQVIARNCDWFIALFVPVVIGRSNCFGFGFSTVIWKPL